MCETKTELPVTDKNATGCSCCATDDASAAAKSNGDVKLQVQGMTCGHCVSSVTEELEAIDGVRDVSVDLDPSGTSTITVDTNSDIDSVRLHAAVTDAGYEVVTS